MPAAIIYQLFMPVAIIVSLKIIFETPSQYIKCWHLFIYFLLNKITSQKVIDKPLFLSIISQLHFKKRNFFNEKKKKRQKSKNSLIAQNMLNYSDLGMFLSLSLAFENRPYKQRTESYFYCFFESTEQLEEMSQSQESQPYAPQESQPVDEQESEQIYKRRVEKNYQNSLEGKWTQEENLKYILFMDYHGKIFVSKEKRKSQRIFKTLSDFLESRTPRQCRSHFQKIMNKFKKIKKIKQYYQEQMGFEKYQQELEKLSRVIQPPAVKAEETAETKIVTSASVQVQTDPFRVQLSDLNNGELLKLMSLLNQFHKSQMPLWVPPLSHHLPMPPNFPP